MSIRTFCARPSWLLAISIGTFGCPAPLVVGHYHLYCPAPLVVGVYLCPTRWSWTAMFFWLAYGGEVPTVNGRLLVSIPETCRFLSYLPRMPWTQLPECSALLDSSFLWQKVSVHVFPFHTIILSRSVSGCSPPLPTQEFYRLVFVYGCSMPRYKVHPQGRPHTRSRTAQQGSRSQVAQQASGQVTDDSSPPSWVAGLLAKVESLSEEVASLKAQIPLSQPTPEPLSSGSASSVPDSQPAPAAPGQGSWTTPAQQPVVSTPSAMMTPGALLAVLQQDAPTEAGTDLAAADLLSGGTGQPGLGLDLFVPTKTKELIWHDHYVDFATLLPTHKHDGGDLQLRQADGSVFLTPARKTQPLTVTQWVSAFSTFMYICDKTPSGHCATSQVYANCAGDCSKGWGFPEIWPGISATKTVVAYAMECGSCRAVSPGRVAQRP